MISTHAVFNVFDDSVESVKIYKSRVKEMEENALPPRVEMLRQRDFAMTRNYCEGNQSMTEARVLAVDITLLLCDRMCLGTAAAWTAIRLFDEFYVKTPNTAWQEQWRYVVAVSVDVAGKVASSDEGNMCERADHLKFMYPMVCGDQKTHFADWKQFFEYVQAAFLRTLNFDVLVATPDEYISECTHWLDERNAARGSPKRSATENEVTKMTTYMYLAIAYSDASMLFSTIEIAGFSSYVATSPIRAAPQSVSVTTPALSCLWTRVPWTRGNKLSQILIESVEFITNNMPNNTLGALYPGEHVKWVAMTL